jgi:hypothetical protein
VFTFAETREARRAKEEALSNPEPEIIPEAESAPKVVIE